jgi:DNA-binding NarL/FixJ family response regulator
MQNHHYHVLIVEDDLYALHMMGMLLARDWRTRVIAEIDGESSLKEIGLAIQKIGRAKERVDLVILDSELLGEHGKALQIAALFNEMIPRPRLLFTAAHRDPLLLRKAAALPNFSGWVLKNELLYGLAAAVVGAMEQFIVITPGVDDAILPDELRTRLQVISCADPAQELGAREKDIAHLGILYNMTQRDIADELVIDPKYVADVMSDLYEILGLHEIIHGEKDAAEVFENPIILRKIQEILPPGKQDRKVANMPTLAFHLLTQQSVKTSI